MLGIWIPDINPKSALIWMPDKLVSCIKDIKTGLLQWGSEIRPIEIGTFWRSDFKWSGLRCGYSYSPNHSKTRPFKILPFLSGFQMLFDKMAYLITFWILDKNGALKKIGLVFRCPSKIGSLANQTFLHHLRTALVCCFDPNCTYSISEKLKINFGIFRLRFTKLLKFCFLGLQLTLIQQNTRQEEKTDQLTLIQQNTRQEENTDIWVW